MVNKEKVLKSCSPCKKELPNDQSPKQLNDQSPKRLNDQSPKRLMNCEKEIKNEVGRQIILFSLSSFHIFFVLLHP